MNDMARDHAHGNYNEFTNQVYDANIDQWMPADEFYAHYGIPTYGISDTRMKTWQTVLVTVSAIFVLLIMIALTASFFEDDADADYSTSSEFTASEDMYLDEAKQLVEVVEDTGGHADAYLISVGQQMCYQLDEDGWSTDEVASAAVVNNNHGLTFSQAHELAIAAADYLCP